MSVLDGAAAACLLLGALLALSAGAGLVRFRTTLDRMHAGTKPQVLGVLLVLLAMLLHRPTWSNAGPLVLAGVSQVISVSVAAYMVARAAYTRQSSLDDDEEDSDGTALPSESPPDSSD
ncbi:monovalent cation/H(+) antiporter subunit G [Nonomuraea zeae]|uniref:Monovalent cation/H(+) antiporter subunit G n=1 Tax=Nonomuraea zeae TaxID=1642303 RepID=A0A5S4G203_9ACTN|nr:monovalent cation/H(+) antiporter subunit G [Nonomuraea zeae]TMR26996.1 monovalent cation/H(+) antiporter subunit G [Nonomuraea zeae]